ncbi:MAG: AI-2E family transporter [Fibrobacter sp.]|nr:AI-2E family transporter [Fibrobacter sp.]
MIKIWTLDKVMKATGIVLGAVVLLSVLYYLRDVLTPFFTAFMLAYIMDPLVCRVQKLVKHRIIAIVIVLLVAFSLVAGILWFLVPMVVEEMRHLGDLVPKIFNDSVWKERISSILPAEIWSLLQEEISWNTVASTLKEADAWHTVQSAAEKVLPGALGFLTKGSHFLLWFSGLFLVFMYLVFSMLDMPKIRKTVLGMTPRRFTNGLRGFGKDVDRFMGNYFRAQSLVALCVGVLYAVGFAIMGLPMGIAFGLVSGALNMVPYLQLATIPIALLLAVVFALERNMPFWEVALIVLAIYGVVQVIQDLFLVPKIVGSSMNLPPVGILLSLSIWGKLLGFLGLVVAIPFTCICIVYFKKIQQGARIEGKRGDNTAPSP